MYVVTYASEHVLFTQYNNVQYIVYIEIIRDCEVTKGHWLCNEYL